MAEVKISVLLDNNLIQADGLARFTYIPSGRPYIIYTLNEKTIQNGESLNKVYVSETGDQNTEFSPIADDEWLNIKSVMGVLTDGTNQVPNNIQLSQLNPQQYVVGPYHKIAIRDEVMTNLLNNQLSNQPAEEQIVQPTGNTQFFDPSLNVSAVEESAGPTEVPNAFSMSTPVPEEAAPMALVQEAVAPAPQVPETQLIQAVPEQTQMVQETPVQPTVVETQVVEQTQVAPQVDEMTVVREALQTVLNYCNGDMNKLNELLKEQGLTVVVEAVNTNEQTAVAQEEYPEPVTSVIDINNLPVVEQEAPAEENVLNEESFEPTTPSLPVDSMEAPLAVAQEAFGLPEIAQEQAPVEAYQAVEMPQPVVESAPVMETPQPLVQEAPTMEMPQPMVQEAPVMEMPQQVVPEVVQPTPAPTSNIEVPTMLEPVQFVQPEGVAQTQLVESAPVETPVPAAVDAIQNTEVNLSVPEEISSVAQAPVENYGMPQITPVTPADMTPAVEEVAQAPQAQDDGIDTSAFLDAGPVIMPLGQEASASQGLPGDSGSKVLERVA